MKEYSQKNKKSEVDIIFGGKLNKNEFKEHKKTPVKNERLSNIGED